MTDSPSATATTQVGGTPRCPACGEPLPTAKPCRCPLCGHAVVRPSAPGEDHTPYAESRDSGERCWWNMCRWIYGAGSERLTHLGLLSSSTASRRFARVNLALFCVMGGLVVFVNSGWHEVVRGPLIGANAAVPSNKAWWHVVSRGVPVPEVLDHPMSTDLWFSLPLAIISAVVAALVFLLLGSLMLRAVGGGGERAAAMHEGGEPRIRCAVDYSTAWMLFPIVGMSILFLSPLTLVGRVLDWATIPSPALFRVPAVLISVIGLAGWWLWLIRLGAVSGLQVKKRVSRHFLVWTPLWCIVLGGGGCVGLWFLLGVIGPVLRLAW